MLTITDGGSLTRALKLPIDLRLKRLLIDRRDQLGGDIENIARYVICEPGDSMKALEQELGFNIFEDADGLIFPHQGFSGRWDWLAEHSHAFEICIEGTDALTHIVWVQKSPMQNRLLRALCLTFADC